MLTFSNPRLEATIENWPLGGSRKGTAVFKVEHDPYKGERVSRTTIGKPKLTTFGSRCCIVDGSNGRTYVLQEQQKFGHTIRVVASDLSHDASEDLNRSSSYFRADWGDDEEKSIFATLLSLIEIAHTSAKG